MWKSKKLRRAGPFPREAPGDGGVGINATDGRVGVVVEKIVDGHRDRDGRECQEGVDDVLVGGDAGSHGVVGTRARLPDGGIAGRRGGLVNHIVEEEVSDRGDFSRSFTSAKRTRSQDGRSGDGNGRAVNRSRRFGGR